MHCSIASHRRWPKWLLLAICLCLALLINLSVVFCVNWRSCDLRYTAWFYRGMIGCGWRPQGWTLSIEHPAIRPGWFPEYYGTGGARPWGFKDLFSLPRRDTTIHWETIDVPLWLPFLAFGSWTIWAFRRDRRRFRFPHCEFCGEKLSENFAGSCPGCGTSIRHHTVLPADGRE